MTQDNRYEKGFDTLLWQYDWDYIQDYDGTIFGLWSDLTLGFMNPAWFRFARDNGGEPAISQRWNLGGNCLDAISPELKPFYENLFKVSISQPSQVGCLPQHVYECSSPLVYRCFSMNLYRLDGKGILVINAPIIEQSFPLNERPSFPAIRELYLDDNGIIHQCSYCRKVKNLVEKSRWDWVPQWVGQSPEEASHTICDICMDHYHPDPYKTPPEPQTE